MPQSLKMQGHIYRHRKNKDIKCLYNNVHIYNIRLAGCMYSLTADTIGLFSIDPKHFLSYLILG